MDSKLKLAVLGHSDHHFGRFYHAVRCFRFGQGCLGPDQHLGNLPLDACVDGCLNGACFSLEFGLLQGGGGYMKIAHSGPS
jgi:hypothetical protein